ncbi:hypothetical protein N7536_005767 [Penicillium majusculum]|nr:hypothetical protein N7536_005767 [Penicillium majusculum]
MAAPSSETLCEMLPAALETLIPGLSLFTRLLFLYSRFDVSTFSSYNLNFILLSAYLKFAVPQLYDNLQKLILDFAASIEITHKISLHDALIKWASENDELKKCRKSIAATSRNLPLLGKKMTRMEKAMTKTLLRSNRATPLGKVSSMSSIIEAI